MREVQARKLDLDRKPSGAASPRKPVPVIPADVRAGQVISLVEVTGGLMSGIDAAQLSEEMGANIAVLLPILDTAEMLGLVESENGKVTLTDFGHKFQRTSTKKIQLLTDTLAKIEPFKTAIELASKYGEVTAAQVAYVLAEQGITWHHDPEINVSLLNTILIHWAIYSRLLTYNKDGKFEVARRQP